MMVATDPRREEGESEALILNVKADASTTEKGREEGEEEPPFVFLGCMQRVLLLSMFAGRF